MTDEIKNSKVVRLELRQYG